MAVNGTILTVVQQLMLDYNNHDDDTDDVTDGEEDTMFALMLQRRVLRQNATDIPRISNYVEEIVPAMDDTTFASHFRVTRVTFTVVLEMLQPLVSTTFISLDKQLLCTLWILATQDSYRSVAEQFGLSKGTLHFIFLRICRAISSTAKDIITWPSPEKCEEIARKFEEKAGVAGVVGCIDGTHIEIRGPSVNRASYVNRKGQTSMQLQAICDNEMKFIDVCVGYPGSVHDARVFRNSSVVEKLERLPNKQHILADSAYPLKANVMVPYRDNGHLTEIQKMYNYKHSSTRVKIEHAFGHVKVKFRRLKKLDMELVKDIPFVVMAACVLHNILLSHEDPLDVNELIDMNNEAGNVCVDDVGVVEVQAAAKRNAIANSL